MLLPESFKKKMKELLGVDYNNFIESYNMKRHFGLRLNRLMNSEATRTAIVGHRKPIPWCTDGYYYKEEDRPAKDPYYFAGAYYIQEPSAMTPAEALVVKKDDLVIDLCAAPGGKSTHVASHLEGTGLLVSNDISHSRVKTLNKNIQISGIKNALVLSEDPVKLAKRWSEVFDKVLVDAPCSGEGMFRKEPKLIGSWEENGPKTFVPIQRLILEAADELLAPGGELVYSTCTYNTQENEENILWFLQTYKNYELVDLSEVLHVSTGFDISGDYDLKKTARVWPHLHDGEGHYIAKLHKKVDNQDKMGHNNASSRIGTHLIAKPKIKANELEIFDDFLENIGIEFTEKERLRLNLIKETLYLMPETMFETKGLRVFANGWLLGRYKKNRFEPSQAFASGLKAIDVKKVVDYNHDDIEVIKYLKGESLCATLDNGWCLVAVDGHGIGFAKVVNRRLKNKIESSWRWQ